MKTFLFTLAGLVIILLSAGCGEVQMEQGINPVLASNLDETRLIVIYDLTIDDQAPLAETRDSEVIRKLVKSLDTNLPVTAKTFCAPRYRLEFHLPDMSTVEMDYFCDGENPFIRSELDYFKNEDYAVGKDFVDVVDGMLTREGIFDEVGTETGDAGPSELANPASVFCEENGGKVDIREDASGNQYGICQFADGSECEEWAFFRGECEPGE